MLNIVIQYRETKTNSDNNKMNISHPHYQEYNESIQTYENNTVYEKLMCLKDTEIGPKNDETKDNYMENINKMPGRDNLKYKCVLPIGHAGLCCNKFTSLYIKNQFTKKLVDSIDKAIYYTPGNDDYVYKNRASRLYVNALSSEEEKKIRNKSEKKKCAIPLKDASTPVLLAQAYLDWSTFMVNIKDISEYINKEGINRDILDMITKNKEHLIMEFSKFNRNIFDNSGNTMCVITRNTIKLSDVSDPTRDNRVNISENDIQLGHNYPRSDNYVSIRGENLLPMSRRGNLIIGEKVFTQDIWINELQQILIQYK